jgi:outer membrane protein assembly complex protein YaeT
MAALKLRLRWVAFGIGGLLALIVLVLSLLHTPPARRYALKQIVQIMGKQGIRFDSSTFDYNLFDLSATLKDVVIQSPQTPDLPPLLRADQASVDIGLRSLIGGKLVVEDATIRNPQVHLVFDEKGRSNIPKLPEKKKTDSETNYLIDKAVITGGELRIEDRRQQATAYLPIRELVMDGNPLTDNHDIKLTTGIGGTVSYQGRQMPLSNVTADALLKKDGVEIRNLTAALGPSTVSASGTVDDFDNLRLNVKADAGADLGSLTAFAGVQQKAEGTARIALTASGTLEQLKARATVSGDDLTLDRLRNVDLKAEAEYDAAASRARVESLNVQMPAGMIQGTADLALKPSAGESTANIRARNLDLQSLSRTFESPVRVASRATADIAARFPAMEFEKPTGDATVRLTATRSTPAKDVVPLTATLNAKTQGNRVVIGIRDLRALDAQAAGQVVVADRRSLDGDVKLEAPSLASTIASAEAFLGREPGTLVGTPVDGPLNIAADLGGTVQNPSVGAELEASGVSAGDLKGIDIQATADYNPNRVVLENATASWQNQVITAAGTAGLKGRAPALNLTAQSQNISIQSVLAGLNRSDLPVSGTASFTAEVRGTTKQPEADVQLKATDLIAYKETLGTLAAQAQLRGRVVNITELRLDKPQEGGDGSLVATGSYNLDTKSYSIDAKSDDLKLTSLTLPDGRSVRAELDFAAKSQGTAEDPSGEVKLAAKDVQVGSDKFGDVNLRANAANGQAHVEAGAPAFNVSAKADVGIKAPYPGTFEVQANDVDLASLPVKIEQPVAGSVTATVRGSGPLEKFVEQGQATAEIAELDLRWRDQPIRSDGPLVARYGNRQVTIDRMAVVAQNSRIELQGTLPVNARTGQGAINLSARLDLPTLMSYVPTQEPVLAQGTATIAGSIRGNLERIDPDISVTLKDGAIAAGTQKVPVTNVGLQANIRNGALELQSVTAQLGVATVNASGTVPFALLPAKLPVELPRAQGPAQFTAELKALSLSDLEGVPDKVSGTVSARINAEAARPELEAVNAKLSFPDLRVQIGSYALEQKGTSEILIENGTARVNQFVLTGPSTELQIAGTAGLTGARPLDVRLDGTFDAAIASAFTDAVQTRGASELKVAVSGTAQKPQAQGYFQLTDAQVSLREPRVGIDALNVRLDLAGTKATLSRLDGVMNGGDLSGSGSTEFANGALRNTNLNIKAADVYMNAPEGLKTVSNIDLQVKSAGEDLVLGGKVSIVEGGYTEEKLTRALLAKVTQPRALDLTQERSEFLENLRFDLAIVTENPIVIDNSLAEAEIVADLRLLGNPYETGLSGRLEILEGGQLRFQEREYLVDRGVVTFTSDRSIEPGLDILATTTAGGYDITLQISGQPGETETVLTSDPPLPEPDILAVLVTGKTMEEIRGQEFEVARNQVLSYLTGRIGSQLGETLSGATGLSMVRIEPNLIASETDPTARLTLGQNITRNLRLIYSMDLVNSSDQIYVAEYDISRRFTTRGVRQSDGSFRGDFRHEVQFGGQPQSRRGQKREQRRIGNVSIVGNKYFTDLKLADKLDVETGDKYDFFDVRKGMDRIEKMHTEANLLESSVRLKREQKEGVVDLAVNIESGPTVDLVFEGASVPGGVQDKVRNAWRDGVFDLQRAEDSMLALRTWLVEEDHLQPKIEHTISTPSEGRKRVVFDIQPGPKFNDVEIVFDGAQGMKASTLKDIIEDQKLSTDVYVAPSKVTELLTSFYQDRGFLDAEMSAPRYELDGAAGTGKVVFPVKEGPLYKVGNVEFDGNTVVTDEQLATAVPLPKSEGFRPVLRENAVQRLKDVYWEKGYNDVETEVQLKRNQDAGTVDLRFQIAENRQSVVRDVVIEGRENTSDNLVRTQLELGAGDILDLKKLGESRRNLYNTGAYSMVEIAREEIVPEGAEQTRARQEGTPGEKPVRLRVKVREIQPFEIRYGGFFDTERGPGAILDVFNRNSLGSARVLGLRTRYDSQLQEARLYFSQPLLQRFPVKTIVSPFIRRERNPGNENADPFNVDRLGFSIQQEARPWEKYVFTYGYRLERTQTYDPLPEGVTADPLRIGSLTATLTRETRDEIMDATRGDFMSHAMQLAPSMLGSQQSFVKYFGQYFKYVPLQGERIELFTNEVLRPRLVYAGGLRVGLANGFGGDEVPRSERFFSGGGTTVRGFEQNSLGPVGVRRQQLGGEAMLVVNNEIRFPLFWLIDGVGFVDIGNVWQNVGDMSFADLRKTAGPGLRLRTPWFLLRVDYGVKLDRRPGEGRGRFFFSIGQAF